MSIRVCSICKSPGVTKSTCPLNKNAKNKNTVGHVNAMRKIREYLKKKDKAKKLKHETNVNTTKVSKTYKNSSCQRSISKYSDGNKLPRIIVLDNDECLGQFGLFSTLYVYARYTKDPYKIDLNILRNSCVKYLFPYGVARPYLINMFKLIEKFKNSGKIDGLIMYTSAPNSLSDGKSGYVYFLKDCIEQYCGTRGIYDKVLHRNNVVAKVSSCGATIKDLGNTLLTANNRKLLMNSQNTPGKKKLTTYVNNYTKYICMVDDKPQNIVCRSGKALGISPYEYEGTSNIFKKCINSVPNLRNKLEYYRDSHNNNKSIYACILEEAEHNHKLYGSHKNNIDLARISKHIKKIYA